MARQAIRIFDRHLPIDLLSIVVFVSGAAAVYGGVRAFYFNSEFLAPIAYITDERISADLFSPLIDSTAEGVLLGRHLFFDFFISYYWGTLPNPYFDLGLDFWPNHTPLAMLVGRAWSSLDYALARDLNVIFMAISVAAVGIVSLMGRRWTIVLLGTTVLVLSGPSIAALDRGNYQGYIPILLLGFGIAALRGRWGWAATFLAIAASFKMYPVILILVFIAERRWRALLGTLLGASLGNFILLLFFEGSPITSATEFLYQASRILAHSGQELDIYNTSLTGGIIHWLNFLGLEGIADSLSMYSWIVALGGSAALASILWFRGTVPLVIRLIAALMLTTTITTHSFPYTLNWAIAAAGLLFLSSKKNLETKTSERANSRLLRWTTTLSIALFLGFYPIFIPGTMESGRPAGAASLVSPVAFFIFVGGVYTFLWVHRRISHSTPANVSMIFSGGTEVTNR